MAFRVSPGVSVTEKDFTNVIPAVSTTKAGYAGKFDWGPINQRVLVANENELVSLFNEPTDYNYQGWLCAANFLGYGGSLTVVRASGPNAANAGSGATGIQTTGFTGALLANSDEHAAGVSATNQTWYPGGTGAGVQFFAKYAGELGNSLRVEYVQRGPTADGTTGTGIVGNLCGISGAHSAGVTQIQIGQTASTGVANVAGATSMIVGDVFKINAQPTKKYTVASIVSRTNAGIKIEISPALGSDVVNGATGQWEFPHKNFVERARTSTNLDFQGGTGDQFSLLIIDQNGQFSGLTGTILESYNHLSKAADARDGDGNSNYYATVINQKSKYVWIGGDVITCTGGTAAGTTFGNTNASWGSAVRSYKDLGSGGYGDPSDGNLETAYNNFADADAVGVDLLISGDSSANLSKAIIDIADARKDCVAFISPEYGDVVDITSISEQVSNVLNFRDAQLNKSSSYAFLDSGWKYMYDRYNDKLRWVPLNGDMAGLCARTDNINDPWFSPAGFNRGQIRGVVKLAMNPTSEEYRNDLYLNEVNPCVAFPGEGTVLFGDKTLQSKGSAFDRINVRRLFIVMEKAISTASKFQLFEQNDTFTRAQFKNMIEPFLRDIQGRRGITDFKVVCDDTNNTTEIIDQNRFVADIFVKPTRSINFIQLNFSATRSGVDFTEVAGG